MMPPILIQTVRGIISSEVQLTLAVWNSQLGSHRSPLHQDRQLEDEHEGRPEDPVEVLHVPDGCHIIVFPHLTNSPGKKGFFFLLLGNSQLYDVEREEKQHQESFKICP